MFLIDMFNRKTAMPTRETALPGRSEPIATAEAHFVNGRPLKGPYPEGCRDRDVRNGMLLGRRAPLLEGAGRLGDRRRLCGRPYAESDLPGDRHRA